jgi:hypothetical protein
MKKNRTFLVILILLFAVNIVFNLNYQWEGLSTIVRVYVFIFSFLMVFYFSSIDIDQIKRSYKEKYGSSSVYMVFFMTRVLPFLLIYLVTVIFTFIDTLVSANWPEYPLLRLLDGKYSNTIFYALILLVVLRLKRPPQVTVPLFLSISVVFFFVDKGLYTYFPAGWIVSAVKFMKYFLFVFVLIFEYLYDRARLLKAVSIALVVAAFIYASVFGIIYSLYYFSDRSSYAGNRTAYSLMKMGFSFPVESMAGSLSRTGDTRNISTLLYYAKKYNKELQVSSAGWEELIVSDRLNSAEHIAGYLAGRGISISYSAYSGAVKKISLKSGKALANNVNLISYGTRYVRENPERLDEDYKAGNIYLRKFFLRVYARSKDPAAVPMLLDGLTSLDADFAKEVYLSLKEICGIDPVRDFECGINSPESVAAFRRCYDNVGIVP